MFQDDEPEAAAVLAVHDPHKSIPLEELIEKAQVTGRDFLALITRCLHDRGARQVTMMASASYPYIMAASVQRAMDPDKGTEERRMHFEHHGFVQPRGGIKIGIKNSNGAPAVPDEPAGPGEAESFDRTARTVVRNLPALTD
jgi:hypothetical protein